MRIKKIMIGVTMTLLISTTLRPLPPARGKSVEPGSGEGALYVSVFWVGRSETDCIIRNTLIADTPEQCQAVYEQTEKEIVDMVARKNKRGGNWQWGVIEKCRRFPDHKAYSDELEKHERRCSGE